MVKHLFVTNTICPEYSYLSERGLAEPDGWCVYIWVILASSFVMILIGSMSNLHIKGPMSGMYIK